MSKQLSGVLTALTTPFDADELIDTDRLKRVVDRSIKAGVDGVVAAGSTGEVGALSSNERELRVQFRLSSPSIHTRARCYIPNQRRRCCRLSIRRSKGSVCWVLSRQSWCDLPKSFLQSVPRIFSAM